MRVQDADEPLSSGKADDVDIGYNLGRLVLLHGGAREGAERALACWAASIPLFDFRRGSAGSR